MNWPSSGSITWTSIAFIDGHDEAACSMAHEFTSWSRFERDVIHPHAMYFSILHRTVSDPTTFDSVFELRTSLRIISSSFGMIS